MKIFSCHIPLTFLYILFSISCWQQGECQEVQHLLSESSYEAVTGLKGSYDEKEKTYTVLIPRNDIKIAIYEIQLDPSMGLSSSIHFTPINESHFLMMGELVLFQDEINPVISALLEGNIEVSALHNHFLYDVPKVYFMHFSGKGTIAELSKPIRNALELVKSIRAKNPKLPNRFGGTIVLNANDIDPLSLEEVLGAKSQTKEGIAKFQFGRNIKIHGVNIGSQMGVKSWIAFAGSNDNAIVDGDFAVKERELQSILKILRKGNIDVLAIHQHMIGEYPRLVYVHFWGKGKALNLAKALKPAIETMSDNKALQDIQDRSTTR